MVMTEADWERFDEAQRNSFDVELVRRSMADSIGRIGRVIGLYPPGVLENTWAARFVAGEILKSPLSPDQPFRTMDRLVSYYLADIDQTTVFWYLQGGRILRPGDEIFGELRGRIIETLEGQTPNPVNPDETAAYVQLYQRITPPEIAEGRDIVERLIRRRKYGELAEYNILMNLDPQQQIDYVKGQLPKVKKYKARNSK